jgi:vacuolar protein sorting-associated protein 35
MLSELRTAMLSPKNYYQLYMRVFDEMRHVEGYFIDYNRAGTPMVELYETVQVIWD